jgi:L-lactate dehydrogenase
VKNSAYQVIKLKGHTNWAIGAAVGRIVQCILKDERRVVPVSTNIKGFYGIERDCCLSLPCTLGRAGLMQVFHVNLSPEEEQAFKKSAATLTELQDSIEDALTAPSAQ